MVGRGLRINFPVSSHDILKSLSTCRVRDVNICGAITNLWMPITKSDTVTNEQQIFERRRKKMVIRSKSKTKNIIIQNMRAKEILTQN